MKSGPVANLVQDLRRGLAGIYKMPGNYPFYRNISKCRCKKFSHWDKQDKIVDTARGLGYSQASERFPADLDGGVVE